MGLGQIIALIKAFGGSGGGSGGGVLVITDDGSGTLDKTWTEIRDAMLSGGAVIQRVETEAVAVLRVYFGKGRYVVISADDEYSASSASGYPMSSN